MPQAFQFLAHAVKPKLNPKNNLFSFQLTAEDLIHRAESDQLYWEPDGHWANKTTPDQLKALMRWSLQTPRGNILNKIPQAKNPDYAAIQPFGLWPALKARKQTWDMWDMLDPGAAKFLDADLLEAIAWGNQIEPALLDPELRLELRNKALLIKSGFKQSQTRDPLATAVVYNCTELKNLPRLLKLQLLELWLYTPNHLGIKFVKNLQPLNIQAPTLDIYKPTISSVW